MKIGILITAVGSLSSNAIITSLNKKGRYNVYGCDIYPAEWHAESLKYKEIFRVPAVIEKKEYIAKIFEICIKHDIKYIFPLVDTEVDVYNLRRNEFAERGITVCITGSKGLAVARDKHRMSNFFEDNPYFKVIPTLGPLTGDLKKLSFPYVAKPVNGRSSQGILYINDENMLRYAMLKDNYIIQPYIKGDIYTVDYIRNSLTGTDFSFTRRELLRTSNGAGVTVHLVNDEILSKAASYIGRTIDINGCINFEFIKTDNCYYLTDINPRFSAGIAFTLIAGYDIVKNHLNCFKGYEIEIAPRYDEMIIAKSYTETIMVKNKIK
ncbi:MAG: ATP-grasp domain-containing protein [Bacteroidota bacterium]